MSRKKISFRDLKTTADVAVWVARLNSEWPERREIVDHIVQQVGQWPGPDLLVIELCSGHGQLARALLQAWPQLRYTGFDSSALLLQSAGADLAEFGSRVSLIEANLNQAAWLDQVPQPVQAIVSMQSLHDLGGEAEVDRIYGLAKQLLAPGGLFLNADLVVPPGKPLPHNPGRRSIARHLELLQSHGYRQVSCSLAAGDFGCCLGYK